MKDVTQDYIDQEEATKHKPVELYHIWRPDLSDERFYTSGDVAVIFPEVTGDEYLPATLKRSLIRYDSELDVTKCTIQAAYVEDPLLEFVAINPIEIYWIKIMKLHRDQSPLEADIIFLGQIKTVTFKGIQADVECVGFEHFLKMPIPMERYQLNCNWQVFDSRCRGLSLGSLTRARAGNIATIKTNKDHELIVGDWVVVSGLGGTGYNGTWQVTLIGDGEHFSYTNTGSDEGETTDESGTIVRDMKEGYKLTTTVTLDATKTILTSDDFNMSPARISEGTRAKVASGNLTPGAPSGAREGDILICFLTQRDNVVPTMSADWTQIYTQVNGTTMRATAWWMRYGETAPNYLITRAAGDTGIAVVVCYRDCISEGDPIHKSAKQNTPGSATVNAPAVTTTLENCKILFVCHAWNDGTCGAFSGTNPVPSEFLDDNTDLGLDAGLAISDGVQIGSGDTAARTATYSTTGYHVGATIALTNESRDGYYIGGVVEFPAENEKRTIVANSGNTITMIYRMVHLEDNDTVNVYPGCDGRNTTCRDKFDNIRNFLGFPYIPIENPALRT
jgi:hypothetical protein